MGKKMDSNELYLKNSYGQYKFSERQVIAPVIECKWRLKSLLKIALLILITILLILIGCTSTEPTTKEIPWTGEGPPPPPSPGTKWIIPSEPPQTTEPADEVNVVNLPSNPFPVSFDEVRHAMDAIERYVMTTTISDTWDECTLTLVISNDGLDLDLVANRSPSASDLGSRYRIVLLGHEANVQPKSVKHLHYTLPESGAIDPDDNLWIRIDLKETWSVFGGGGSRLSWHVPLFFTQIRAEIHRPLLFDPRIPSDFFGVSIQGGESWDGLELTRILVRTDWMAVFQWLIDSGNLTRAWEGPHDEWNSEVELWVDEQNLVRQMKVGQSDWFAVYWEVWVHEPFGAASYGYPPQFPAQDVLVDFYYDEVPEVVPPVSNAVVLTRDMLR